MTTLHAHRIHAASQRTLALHAKALHVAWPQKGGSPDGGAADNARLIVKARTYLADQNGTRLTAQ